MEIILLIVTLIIIIAPFSLFFHELGHLVGAKLRSATKILLTIGVGKVVKVITIQNIDIHIRRFFIVNSFTSTVREQPYTNKEKVFITIMGPLFSCIIACVFYVLYYGFSSNPYFFVTFLFNAWLVCINLIPFKIDRKQSDGYIIMQILFERFSR